MLAREHELIANGAAQAGVESLHPLLDAVLRGDWTTLAESVAAVVAQRHRLQAATVALRDARRSAQAASARGRD